MAVYGSERRAGAALPRQRSPGTRSRAPPTRNDAEDGSAQGRRDKTRWRGVSGQLLPEINSGLSGISTMEQL